VSLVAPAHGVVLDVSAAPGEFSKSLVVRIFPPASGRVVSIAVKPGDHVQRWQTLAVLNSSDVASARSDFTKAKIESERATRVMEREKLLFEHGVAAEKDYVDAGIRQSPDYDR
jgi:membrane fusion protein, heavy metal efflux system